MKGWISLHRSIQSHWIWNDPVKLKWWIDILISVNHEDNKINIGLKLIECKRGQSVMSLSNWGKRWSVSKDKVRNFFELLKSDNMIHTENLSKTTRITVCNYDIYQSDLHDNSPRSLLKVASNSPQSHPNNNDNNENNNIKAEFECFFDAYHKITGLKKTDKQSAEKYFLKLSKGDRKKALDNIRPYHSSLSDPKYCKKCRTYLSDKNFNDEFTNETESTIHRVNKLHPALID